MKDKLFICNDCGKPTNNKSSLKMPFNNVVAIHRCDACQDKLDAKYEWQNEKFKEDNIICPWCEEDISDYEDMCEVTDEPYKNFEGIVKCPFCEKEFKLEIEVKCQYTSRKTAEQFDYDEWQQKECEEE